MSEDIHFNTKTYDSIKTHLKTSLEHVIAAGHNVKEFTEFTLDKFGDTYIPHLQQFLTDVSKGEIKIKGLSKAAKTAIVGRQVSMDEREAMIREAAYYRAEGRGFATGHEHEDWIAAEREVDIQLAEEAGLIDKGRKVLESTAINLEKELKNLKSTVTAWLDEKYGSVKKAAAKKKASAKKAVKKKSVKKKAAAKKETEKKETKKKPAAKKSAKKKAVSKKSAKKESAKEKSVKEKSDSKKTD